MSISNMIGFEFWFSMTKFFPIVLVMHADQHGVFRYVLLWYKF
jgi:hypothetical protein